jgi:hypothetical protein
MTFVWSLGEMVLVQPFRLGLGALARTLRWRTSRPPVSPMSGDWLRQHEVDAHKHHTVL